MLKKLKENKTASWRGQSALGELAEDGLLKIEGHEQKLAGLAQECYAVALEEANKQVKGFFEKNT